jgi:carboxypeptidase Taq
MNPQDAYSELLRRSRERALLASCIELISWDELTYMPPGGVENRGLKLAYLHGLYHRSATDPVIGELIAVAGEETGEDPQSAKSVNLREWARLYQQQSRIPQSLVEELATVETTAQQAWGEARRANDFSQALPWLENIIRLKQHEAECLGFRTVPYDALLESYEPGLTTTELTELFAALRQDLAPLLARVQKPRNAKPSPLHREYSVDRQKILVETLVSEIGFDFQRGRLDTTSHPFFSAMGPGDCRITTRYNANDLGEAVFATLHELGHGLYEQGVSAEHYGTPMGETSTMSIHESQSQFWEKFIGRSLPFWQFFFPRVKELFRQPLRNVTLEQFHASIQQVEPGWNRVRADPLTYDLHILIRFELERDLIAGELRPRDLPTAWNEKYRQDLGVEVRSDAEGCLQDSHWPAGYFGYFPTYTLGNIYAAQIFARMRADLPQFELAIAEGEFGEVRQWLQTRVYNQGQRFPPKELIRYATGDVPGHLPLVAELRRRYLEPGDSSDKP